MNKYIWRTVFSPFPQVIDVTKHQNSLILFIKKSFLILQRKCHHPKLTLIFPSVFLPNVSLDPDLPKWNKRPNIHDIKYYYCLHMVLWDNLLYVTSGPNFVLSCQLVPRTSLLQYLKIKLFIVSRNNSRILTISRIPLHCLLQTDRSKNNTSNWGAYLEIWVKEDTMYNESVLYQNKRASWESYFLVLRKS